MEFTSITDLRAEYRDNPNYAVSSAVPAVIEELKASGKYNGYSDEQLEVIAKSVIAKRNSMTLDMDMECAIAYDGLPIGTEWSQFSYEEILAMESQGVVIPQEFIDWAHSMQDNDSSNFIIDESSMDDSTLNDSTDPQVAMQKKAIEFSKKCKKQEQALDDALIAFMPKKEKAEEIENQSKITLENGMKKLTDMAKRWNELDKKLQNGEVLTELEKKEYNELNQSLNGANADLRNKMSETRDHLTAVVNSMDNITDDVGSGINLANETIELANTIAGVQSNYHPMSIRNNMNNAFSIIGDLATMIYGAKGKSIARDTVDAGIDLQEFSNNTQVEINKNTSLYEFALEYGSSLDSELTEVEKLLGENPNKDDNTAVNRESSKAAENAEENAEGLTDEAGDNVDVESPATEVTTGSDDESVAPLSTASGAPASDTEENAQTIVTAQNEPVKSASAKPDSNEETSSSGSKEEVSLDDQGENATEDAKSVTPKVEKEAVETQAETAKAAKTQKEAKAEVKALKADEKAIVKEENKVQQELTQNNNEIENLNEQAAEAPEEASDGSIVPADASAKTSETLALVNGKIVDLNADNNKKSTDFLEKAEELNEDAENTEKATEKSEKYNSKIEKGISYIDQIAAMGLMKGTSTMGTGAVMMVQGVVMQAVGTSMLSNPFTAAAGAAMITAGHTTSTIGTGALNVGTILTQASFFTLAATKATKMTIAACNGDLKGVFKNLGAFTTVVASSIASCAATVAVGVATMGAGPVATAAASQASALPFDALAYTANKNLSNANIKSDDKKDDETIQSVSEQASEELNQKADKATETTVAQTKPQEGTMAALVSNVSSRSASASTPSSPMNNIALTSGPSLAMAEIEQNTKSAKAQGNGEDVPEGAETETQKAQDNKEEVTEDSVKTSEGEKAAKENKKEGENVDKENKNTQQAAKDAKKENKSLKKSDKELQKEIKELQKEVKQNEEKIKALTEESEASLAELDAETANQSEESASAQPVVAPVAQQSMSMSATSGNGIVTGAASPAVQQSAPSQNPISAAKGGSVADRIINKLNANVEQITSLQKMSVKSTKKLEKNLKTQERRAVKAQKAAEKKQKQQEKLDKALTYVDYAATATKLTGKVFMSVGTAQVTSGTAMVVTGMSMLSNPFTAAAGAALVSSGLTMYSTGTGNVGVGNTLDMVGTYTGMAVKLTKTVIAACNGDLAGVITNAASLGMSCIGGFPAAKDAAEAIKTATQTGFQMAQDTIMKASMQQAVNEMTKQTFTNMSTQAGLTGEMGKAALKSMATDEMMQQSVAQIYEAGAKEAMGVASKKALANTAFKTLGEEATKAIAANAAGAGVGAVVNKMDKDDDKKGTKKDGLTDRKKTAQVIEEVKKRGKSNLFGGSR